MNTFKVQENKLKVDIDTTELKSHQVRLIKSLNTLVSNLMTTDNEEDFFETTNELVRMIANAVKKSNFAEVYCEGEAIPYAEQALEFALDHLSDEIHQGKFVRFDN